MFIIKTVTEETQSELTEKNSKFFGILFPCKNVEIFNDKLKSIRITFPDASHYCYAYRIRQEELQEFANDDGEPGGTAGMPILNRLKSHELQNAGLVVVRYFGGTKLGKAGLIRAYGTCAGLCLDEASVTQLVEARKIYITFPYQESNRIEKLINSYHCKTVQAEYLEKVSYWINCPLHETDKLLEELDHYQHLDIRFETGEKNFMTLD